MGYTDATKGTQEHPIDPERFDFVPKKKPLVSSSVLGMALFVFVELMLFMGMVSSYLIVRTNAVGGEWPPPDQPTLPIMQTAFNSIALLLSGFLLYRAHRMFRKDAKVPTQLLAWTFGLGAYFVAAQGMEWVALIRQGLTLQSSSHGSFFYLIIGTHGLHAVAALVFLGMTWWGAKKDRFNASLFYASEVFWYFVVGVWPLLYWLVYL